MKITDEMLYRHAAEARDIWLDTLPNDDELPNHQFSDEFMANIKNAEAQQKRKKTSRKYLQLHLSSKSRHVKNATNKSPVRSCTELGFYSPKRPQAACD